MFCKKGVPRNFTKFTGKQLCQGLFFNKVASSKLPKTELPVFGGDPQSGRDFGINLIFRFTKTNPLVT